jgi:hypothetical protein
MMCELVLLVPSIIRLHLESASRTEKAHKSTIWLAKHLPQNRDVFMTLGGNGSLNLWKYEYPDSRTKKEGEHEKGVAGKVLVGWGNREGGGGVGAWIHNTIGF